MGYPMTFRRVLNRNGLVDGDYTVPPTAFLVVDTDSDAVQHAPYWREQAKRYEHHVKTLAGDLRRLERDSVDENAVCRHIAEQTGIDVDDVAAVLKAFIAS